MNKVFLVILFVACLLRSLQACSQDFPMLHYTVEEGLPGNTVYDVYRDTRGFIWIATDKGVARFNGIKFETFSTSNGMPDNEIFFIQQDKNDRLWFGSFNGKLCFYKNDTFHNAENTPFLKLPGGMTHTQHISVEYDSSLIISFAFVNIFVTINKDRCKVYNLDSLHNPGIAQTVVFRKKVSANRYKLICSDKIVVIDTFCRMVEVQEIDDRFKNPSKDFSGCQDREYMFNGKIVYTPAMQFVRKLPEDFCKNNLLHEVYEAKDKIFYATNNGVFVNDTLHILKENNASSITQDNEGNYWISTLNNGVYVLKKGFLRTKIFRNVYNNQAKYALPYNGHVYFVTEANDMFDLADDRITALSENKKNNNKFDFPVDFGFNIDDHRIFNSYKAGQIAIFDLNTKRTKEFNDRGFVFKELFIAGDHIYGRRGFDFYRLKYGKSDEIYAARKAGGNINERIFCMSKDKDDALWYSTIGNMYRITNNDSEGVVQRQFKGVDFKYFDFFGDYLVGYTQNNQLLVCTDYKGRQVHVDSISPARCVWDKLYRIDNNHVLISTNNLYMLLTLNKQEGNGKFPVRPVENPFVPLHAEAFCSEGSNCYFFKNHSVTIIDDKSILEIPDPPKLHFAFLKTGKKSYPISDDMQISFGESRHMSISFTTQSFNAKDVQYQYSVSKNGLDNWRDVSGEEINLVNSEYGTYFIRVRAKSISSDYCVPVVFTLHVLRPFWATLWFVALFIVAIILITGFAVRYGVFYVLRKKEKEHETEIKFMRSEYKALNALMNPHFIFNTLNNVQGLVNRNDKLAANEYIRVFADLVRQNMHNISKELIPLQKETDLVANYLLLEKLRFKDHLNYSINIEEGLDLSEIDVPPLLVQPLVENSIKHGILPLESKEGLIIIDIYERDGSLHIDVKDNGVGMNAQKNNTTLKHESFGLQNIQKRIEHLSVMQNRKIGFNVSETKDAMGKLQWTIVSIVIPL